MTEKDVRETPPELFQALDDEFHFTLDACADGTNYKCSNWYGESDNGLTSSWAGERVWCNPPFSDIRPWVEKAWHSDAEYVVMLVPANRTEQPWWQDCVEPYRDLLLEGDGTRRLTVRFLRGRTRFLKDGKQMGSPNFACCLLIWTR